MAIHHNQFHTKKHNNTDIYCYMGIRWKNISSSYIIIKQLEKTEVDEPNQNSSKLVT